MPDPMVLARLPRRRGAVARSDTWWGRAFVRSFEETAVDADDLAGARSLARSGRLGAVVVLEGMASVVVDPGAEQPVMAQLRVERLDDDGWTTLAREAARESRFAAALESGQLPVDLVEHADEAGAEVLPGPGELETACDCDAWAQPCRHTLALLYQLAWHVDGDPYVLLLLRGRTREALLDAVSAFAAGLPAPGAAEREEARGRAAHVLALAADAPTGHGLADAEVAAYDEAVSRLVPSITTATAHGPT
ncbi:SWIM zinc finger family protein [Nocardioides marmoraquaticus]